MNAKLYNLNSKSCFPCYISQFFVRSDIFCSYIYFFVCLCCFSFCSCFHILRLLSQMLRLEFHINQRGLKRHHWSTSSWLTASPLAIQSVTWLHTSFGLITHDIQSHSRWRCSPKRLTRSSLSSWRGTGNGYFVLFINTQSTQFSCNTADLQLVFIQLRSHSVT